MEKHLSDGRAKEKEHIFNSQIRNLAILKTSAYNKQKIDEFIRDKQLTNVSNTSITPYLAAVVRLLSHVKKDFKDITTNDVKGYFAKMQSSKCERGDAYADITIYNHQRSIKSFFKWLNGGEIFPDCVKWIKRNGLKKTNVANEDLISVDEIDSLIRHTNNTRDQAIIATLYDSAARAWEFCNVRIKDVRFDKLGALMRVTGKTGTRDIRLINSVPYLQAWMQVHPFREDENTFLWYNLKGHKWAQVSRKTLERILSRTAERAKINKNIYPHLLRHSRLTELAPKIPEQALKAFAGWGQDSRMAAVYIHMSNKHVDDALAKAHGLQIEEDVKESKLAPKTCPRCKEKNPATAKFCYRCSMVLDLSTAVDLTEIMAKDDDATSVMFEELQNMQNQMGKLFERIEELQKTKATIKAIAK